MKRILLLAVLIAFGAGAVFAQSDPIAERQGLMKANGKAAQAIAGMLKGTAPFDLATVQTSLKTFINAANKGPDLFPDNSKTGEDTHALPAIWENKADFVAHFQKLGADSTALLASSMRTTTGAVLKTAATRDAAERYFSLQAANPVTPRPAKATRCGSAAA
jgi:cytochrome c556